MKFDMPTDPAAQIRMHEAMLKKICIASQEVIARRSMLLPELARRLDTGEDVKKLSQAKKELRYQELCLLDQERRLKERISCLQTGSLMTISVAAE
ncbi:MAG: hypothetical protein WA137_02190, partial [Methanothrix sp.]